MPIHFQRRALCLATLALLAAPASAQRYPDKPIRIIVPFSAGGGADVLVRALAQKLNERLGQPVVVENRPGANGIVAAEAVAGAPADGHVLMLGSVGTHAINPSLYEKLPYDALKDFAPVALLVEAPNVLVVNAAMPVHTVAELVAYAKARPGVVSYASSGNGSSQHLSAAVFENLTGTTLTHVPYKGASQALPDLLSGIVHVSFTGFTTVMPYVRKGQLRALGVTTPARVASLPDVPTIAEAGVAGYESVNWLALFAPARTPASVMKKLHDEVISVMNEDATLKALMAPDGYQPNRKSMEEAQGYVRSEAAKWRGVIGKAHIRIE